MGKCCANCFWCFTPEDEEELEGYDDDDVNKPQAGDCCIGMEHDEQFYCNSHSYIDGMEEYYNYVLYDEQYLGPGYLIVSKLDDEIVKFVKISSFGDRGFPGFSIRAYEKGIVDNPEEEFREISFDIKRGEPLYDAVYNFGIELAGKITSTDPDFQGKNYLSVVYGVDDVSLVIAKDVYGVKESTDFVDIFIGDNNSCEKYSQLFKFYNNLSTISAGIIEDKDIKTMLLEKK